MNDTPTLLQELWNVIHEEKKAPKSSAAASVYHRDYLNTKHKKYRQFDKKKRDPGKSK